MNVESLLVEHDTAGSAINTEETRASKLRMKNFPISV